MNLVSFDEALKAVKEGKRIARNGWNGKNMWIEMQTPDINSKMPAERPGNAVSGPR